MAYGRLAYCLRSRGNLRHFVSDLTCWRNLQTQMCLRPDKVHEWWTCLKYKTIGGMQHRVIESVTAKGQCLLEKYPTLKHWWPIWLWKNFLLNPDDMGLAQEPLFSPLCITYKIFKVKPRFCFSFLLPWEHHNTNMDNFFFLSQKPVKSHILHSLTLPKKDFNLNTEE